MCALARVSVPPSGLTRGPKADVERQGALRSPQNDLQVSCYLIQISLDFFFCSYKLNHNLYRKF